MVQASPFCGKANEEASAHLQQFQELCSTFTIRGVSEDAIHLHLFPFSLLGRAKQWFYANREKIDTWEKCATAFLANSFHWAKPMPCVEEFRVFSKQHRNLFPRCGKGSRSTSWPVLTTGWVTGLFYRVSTTG
ncbi:unnamed protein product [Urochloa humidicola]